MNKAITSKGLSLIDKKIQSLVKTKDNFSKNSGKSSILDPITKEDLEKLKFSDDLGKLKAIQRERLLEDVSSLLNEKIKELEKKEKESMEKEKVLLELASALNTKINQLEESNIQLQTEKKYSEKINDSLKTTMKKLSDAEIQLKIERDWLAEQVEKKSMEVLRTIDQLIKAENGKSSNS